MRQYNPCPSPPGDRPNEPPWHDDRHRKLHQATIDDVVAHIDHIRAVAGIDAIGLRSDFDGVTCVPAGLEDVSKWPNLTRKLLEKGYTPADIRKIYRANLLRFMKSVEGAPTRKP